MKRLSKIGYQARLQSATDTVLSSPLPRQQIDLLQIDTEGAYGYILSLFPFDPVQPSIIHWEVKHLSTQQRAECLDRLAAFGYRFALSGDEDLLAVLDAQQPRESRPSS